MAFVAQLSVRPLPRREMGGIIFFTPRWGPWRNKLRLPLGVVNSAETIFAGRFFYCSNCLIPEQTGASWRAVTRLQSYKATYAQGYPQNLWAGTVPVLTPAASKPEDIQAGVAQRYGVHSLGNAVALEA